MKLTKEHYKYKKKTVIPSWLLVIFIFIFIGEMLIYAWCRVQYTQTGYKIMGLAERKTQLMKLKNELIIEQARLKSPERIIRIASKQLDLVMPCPDQMKVIH